MVLIGFNTGKAATTSLYQRFHTEELDLVFIQEPWINAGQITGFGKLKVKERTTLLLNDFFLNDTPMMKIHSRLSEGRRYIIISSIYLPYDVKDPPFIPTTRENTKLVNYCRREHKQFLARTDLNHVICELIDTNSRGESLKYS